MVNLQTLAFGALLTLVRISTSAAADTPPQGGSSGNGPPGGGGSSGGSNAGSGKGAAPGAAHGGGGGFNPDNNSAEVTNVHFGHWLFLSIGAMASIILLWQMFFITRSYIRHIVSINGNQKYWSMPESWFMHTFKKQMLWAPLFGKRHNREFRLSAATSVGTLPSRLQTFLLLSVVGSNVAFTLLSVDWTWKTEKTKTLSSLRNRSGILATVNMVPLFLLAGRNNPLIPLLRCSFDGMNMIHRWLGRIVVIEALVHTAAWMASKVVTSGWGAVQKSILHSEFIFMGFLATIAFTAIMLLSPSILRHAFYETFLGVHILLAIFACVGLYQHLAISDLRHWLIYLRAAIIVWGVERFVRLANILYRNIGISTASSTATITAASDACIVEVTMPRPWRFKPGQHVYLMFPSLTWCWWQSHPFSVAWTEDGTDSLNWDEKKSDMYSPNRKPKIELVVRTRTGMTGRLFEKVNSAPSQKLVMRCLVEGPYGGLHQMDSFGTVFLVAGGVGITHQIMYLRELLNSYSQGISPVRKVTLCWVLSQPTHLQWVKSHMTKVLAMEGRREVLKVLLFVTQPNHSREIMSPSSTVQLYPGKPNFSELVNSVIQERVGTIGVSVCGPGALADDVRCAVREKSHIASMEFFEESFSW